MKKTSIKVKVDKKLDELPTAPIFKKKFESAKLFLSSLKLTETSNISEVKLDIK